MLILLQIYVCIWGERRSSWAIPHEKRNVLQHARFVYIAYMCFTNIAKVRVIMNHIVSLSANVQFVWMLNDRNGYDRKRMGTSLKVGGHIRPLCIIVLCMYLEDIMDAIINT